ncbi:5-oxoprolinase subunit PxpB [Neobacillus kokaensis]|uniref:Allophanate hydrolase n=1 Tax=Neobacillus kokaensis TaxID=2759023 RepID=A0ABQ3N0U6_9BACI|nr:5-oxoprolinase subunit PxpB [Neobacillus kokaensis]GHH97699.1 allophanate hydrolase [Neobacillus kokaensis]
MIEIKPLGDKAIKVSFGKEISEMIHQKIKQFITQLEAANIIGIIELVPAYNSVAIYYQPEFISFNVLVNRIKKIYKTFGIEAPVQSIVYEIPVYYGGATGPDLSYIADYHKMSKEDVIELHSSQEYLIYMLGFVPGFPYLGGLPKKLAVPRLEHPRPSVAAGSVGIGGNQTGIYPSVVPSGWRILGVTPVTLFDIKKTPPSLFSTGNYIKFDPIDGDEFTRIKQLVNERKYTVKTYRKGLGE